MHRYTVTVTSKFPAYGEQPGELLIFAVNAKQAISRARDEMHRLGHTRQDGPLIYRATRSTDTD